MVGSTEDRVVNTVVYIVLVLVAVVSVFPLLYVLGISVTPYGADRIGDIIPTQFTLQAYADLLANPRIPRALGVTVFITVVGTALNMVLTTLLAYPLSRRDLRGRRLISFAVLFTMLFHAGMIPTFMIVKATGLLDTVWAMIIPNAILVFNVLIMKTFFEGLPDEIIDSARVDGASELQVLRKIVLPLSVPVMLVLSLFYGVNHWNEFYHAILYIRDTDLLPLQVVIRDMLAAARQEVTTTDVVVPSTTIRMAAVMLAAIPMIAVYPFIQKHFQKAVLIGAIKG